MGYLDGESIITFASFAPLRFGFVFKPPASLKTPGTLNSYKYFFKF